MQRFTINVPICSNNLVLEFDSITVVNYVHRYQLYAALDENQAPMSWFNVRSDGLDDKYYVEVTSKVRNMCFLNRDRVIVRAGRFTLEFIAMCDFDSKLSAKELIAKCLPAIVTAYVDERWRRGVNKADSELLTELQASVRSGNSVDKMREEQQIICENKIKAEIAAKVAFEEKIKTKAEEMKKAWSNNTDSASGVTVTAIGEVKLAETPKPVETPKSITVKYYDTEFELVKIEKRCYTLENTWQFAIIPSGRNMVRICATTIEWSTDKVNIHDTKKIHKLIEGDVIGVETSNVAAQIRCNNLAGFTNIESFIRKGLLDIVHEISHKMLNESSCGGFDKELITNLYNYSLKAIQDVKDCANKRTVALSKKMAERAAKSAKNPTNQVKYLCGLARREQILGITTVRFGTMIKKCMLELRVPDQVSIKNMDVSKFQMIRVKRNMVRNNSAEIIKLDAAFNIDGEVLRVMSTGVFSEYYITYDGKLIYTEPFGIDFEFDNKAEVSTD